MVQHENIIQFLKELKYSHHDMERIFTDGSCFRLCKILASVCTGAEFYYSQKDGHWITKYNDRFYDINGELDQEYVVFKQYEHIVDYRTLASAYVPKTGGGGYSYSRSIESV